MTTYKGLNDKIQVVPGPRTGFSRRSDLPLSENFVTNSADYETVSSKMVYPFAPQKCFDVMKNYCEFLKSHLKTNEKKATKELGKQFHAEPTWVSNVSSTKNETVNGEVHSMVQYAYYRNRSVYWLTDKITTLDDGLTTDADGNKVFRFAMKRQDNLCKPTVPAGLAGYSMYLVFTSFEQNPDQCHVTLTKKFKKSSMFKYFPMTNSVKSGLEGDNTRELFSLWMLLHNNYSSKLPKKDSKILVVGAGPSGLHMSYELIQRGLNPSNLTILEKDPNHYGGKTLSIEDRSNVQISDAEYNQPLPRLAFIPKVSAALKKYYTGKALREAIQAWLNGTLSIEEFKRIERENTPNALQEQHKEDYYNNGEPVYHELGTCYLSPGYYAIRSLLKEIQGKVEAKALEMAGQEQGKWEKLAAENMTREVGPDTYSIESSEWDGTKTLEEWIVHAGKEHTLLDDIFSCTAGTQAMGVNASVMAAKLSYCKLHNSYLGNYTYTLPPKPSEERFDDLIKPFGLFLEENDLMVLMPLFTYALTAQGYGIIETTPTFLAMQWLTPDLLDGYFEWYLYFQTYKNSAGEVIKEVPESLKKFNNHRKGMLVSGWGGLWDRIVALYNLDSNIKFGTDISKITRSSSEKESVTVEYTHQGQKFTEKYDFLVMAAPLSDAAIDSTVQTLPLDLNEMEAELFLNKNISASVFCTNLFKPEENGNYQIDHLRIFIDAILNEDQTKVGTGDVFGVRDSYKAVQPRLSTEGGHKYDPAKDTPREKMRYQYVSPANSSKLSSSELLLKNFQNFMLDHPDYFSDVPGEKMERIKNMLIYSKAWTYYTHYEGDALKNGYIWRILTLQGERKTFFVHASTNFESVLDIVNYNNMLLDGLSGRLDDFIKPETDTRPEPWERPQQLLFNRLTIQKAIKAVLNFIILVVWSIWYVISYPLAEGVYLRFQRYNLQKAFKTPELGSPWSFNMSHFNNVSPTVRGYMDLKAGKPNGIPDPIPIDYNPTTDYDTALGPGDTIFKIMQAPKTRFYENNPGVPTCKEIETSIQWNYTDLRAAIEHWLTTFDDSFQPLLTPNLQKVIEAFSFYLPNYYSWIFSWIFATQFRLLIGFSYRFEDEKGGGLRIPECHMLKTAIKDHGVEIGRRVCLTVCKIFTEEVMNTKRMKIDFQPDFIEGDGYGCSVRMVNPRNHAFSNHSTYQFRNTEEDKKFKAVDLSW